MKKKTPRYPELFDVPPFLLHPENEKVLYKGIRPRIWFGTADILFIVVLLASIGLLFLPILIRDTITDLQTQQLLEQKGTETTAQIISHWVQVEKSTSYYITYRFAVNNQDGTVSFYQKQALVNEDTYSTHTDSSPIQVLYLSSDPNISMLGGNDRPDSTNSLLLILFVFTCYLGPLCFLLAVNIFIFVRDQRWKKATLLPGAIYRTDAYVTHGKHFNLIVWYEFRSPSGIQLFGEDRAARDNHELPRPGTPVAVLYLNHEEFKML